MNKQKRAECLLSDSGSKNITVRLGGDATRVAPKAERTGKGLPLGSHEPGLGQVAETRAVLKSMAKSLDIFLPGYSGWCSQKPFIKWNQLARILYCDLGTRIFFASFCSLCTHCVCLGNLTGRTGSCRVDFQ